MVSKRFRGPMDRREFLHVGGLVVGGLGTAEVAAAESLPAGVKVVWDLGKAYRETTPTRERVCLNGLWRWQPAKDVTHSVPADGWGYFKVPGFWPGNANYDQENCQTLHVHPTWKDADVRGVAAAWYQREITVPDGWAGRRIALCAEYVNSFAIVFVDGKKVSEIRFPAGEADLSPACRSGHNYVLSLLVIAMPLKGVLLSYTDSNSAKEVRGSVERRGLCGDVYLTSTPSAARVADVKVDTSVRKGEITIDAALEGVEAEGILLLLDQAGICVSSGSACTTGSLDPSHVLLAMGCSAARARGSIRFSLGIYNTDEEVEYVLKCLPGIISRLRANAPIKEGRNSPQYG